MNFTAAVATALAQARTATGVSITYQRDSDEVSLTATPGKTEFELAGQEGLLQRIVSRDFLIRPADLVLNGSQTEPQRGDRIIEITGGTTRTYEVLLLSGQPCWRWTDQHHTEFRIHTKLIAET